MKSEYKSEKIPSKAILIWLLGAVFFFYEFLLQIAPGVMQKDLMQSFSINATQFGNLAAFYLFTYGAMQVPAGMLLDRFGPRRLLTFAAAMCSIGTVFFGMTQFFHLAEIARALTGLGSAFAMLGALVLTANWFATNRFALLHGLILTIGMLGAVFGSAPLSIIIDAFGWRETMITFGLIGVGLTLLIWFFIQDYPEGVKKIEGARSGSLELTKLFSGLIKIVKSPQSWLTALFGALMYAPTPAMSLWGPSFLPLAHQIDKSAAAGLISTMYFGWIIGSPFFGELSDRIGRRKTPLYISAIGTLITISIIIYVHEMSLTGLGISFLLFGFFTCGFVPAFSLLREQNRSEYSGTALGFMNMMNSLGPGIAQPAIGVVLDLCWQGQLENGQRIYSLSDYSTALFALPVCILLAFIILPFIKETYCRTEEQRILFNAQKGKD